MPPELPTALVIVRRLGHVNDRLPHGHLDKPAQSPTTVFYKFIERVLPQQTRGERVAGQQLVYFDVIQGDLLLPLDPWQVTAYRIAKAVR